MRISIGQPFKKSKFLKVDKTISEYDSMAHLQDLKTIFSVNDEKKNNSTGKLCGLNGRGISRVFKNCILP